MQQITSWLNFFVSEISYLAYLGLKWYDNDIYIGMISLCYC